MNSIPRRVEDRLVAGIKKFQPILATAKSRDVNESDTVLIIIDILAEVFGYEKYEQITSELAIRGTFCDLAIKIDGKVLVLIEVKAIGLELKEHHIKQAIDYAANKGVEWAVLTNGIIWRIYRVVFTKPIEHELLAELDFQLLNPKDPAHAELLFILSEEGWSKFAMRDYHAKRQALSRFSIGAVVLSEPVLAVIRRELRRISPDVKIEPGQIAEVLGKEVIKRDVLENEKFLDAKRAFSRAAGKALRIKTLNLDSGPEAAGAPNAPDAAAQPAAGS